MLVILEPGQEPADKNHCLIFSVQIGAQAVQIFITLNFILLFLSLVYFEKNNNI